MRFDIAIIRLSILLPLAFVYGGQPKFLLLLGPSGVGKSTVIKNLEKIDSRFVYIKPYTTRPLRVEETDKIYISLEDLTQLQDQNRLVALNHLYGNYYGTPLDPIEKALKEENFPVLDWPVHKVAAMRDHFGDRILAVYLYVDDPEIMEERLGRDFRDPLGKRLQAGIAELAEFFRGDFDASIDYKIGNQGQDPAFIAKAIRDLYVMDCQVSNPLDGYENFLLLD